jgi:hypothetical protein
VLCLVGVSLLRLGFSVTAGASDCPFLTLTPLWYPLYPSSPIFSLFLSVLSYLFLSLFLLLPLLHILHLYPSSPRARWAVVVIAVGFCMGYLTPAVVVVLIFLFSFHKLGAVGMGWVGLRGWEAYYGAFAFLAFVLQIGEGWLLCWGWFWG